MNTVYKVEDLPKRIQRELEMELKYYTFVLGKITKCEDFVHFSLMFASEWGTEMRYVNIYDYNDSVYPERVERNSFALEDLQKVISKLWENGEKALEKIREQSSSHNDADPDKKDGETA